MGARNPNHRLVKIHRSYTVEQIATLFGAHRNTVRAWLKQGLERIDKRRPTLVHGSVLVAYLRARRERNKRPCKPGEIFCVRCREARRPAKSIVAYQPITIDLGNLVGACSVCDTRLFRRASLSKLAAVTGALHVSMPEALQHIDESPWPSVNSDFRQDATDHG